MFEEARNAVSDTTRKGLALYFGTINLAGETITNPGKIIRGIERRGEKVLDRIEDNNRQIRRSVTLLQKRTSETASSVRGTARATVGLATSMADDVTAPAPRRSTSSTGRKRSSSRSTSARTRVAAAGRSAAGTASSSTSSSKSTSTRSTSATATAKARSQAAQKAARTRALNERKAELKKARTIAKAKATRAKNESKTTLDKAADSVQHGFQVMGERLENVGERIERSVEKVAS